MGCIKSKSIDDTIETEMDLAGFHDFQVQTGGNYTFKCVSCNRVAKSESEMIRSIAETPCVNRISFASSERSDIIPEAMMSRVV